MSIRYLNETYYIGKRDLVLELGDLPGRVAGGFPTSL